MLLLLGVLLSAPAFAREWHITRFVSNVSVAQDGTMQVREHLVVQFEGEYHGMFRRRVGSWRIVFRLKSEERIVLVADILRRTSTTY